ncbi:MAG TPA: NUDIX domain-containing protein [Stellaceae bacterium]|nr:NUDIX domain-containing protein [Stellaceae bacterium]
MRVAPALPAATLVLIRDGNEGLEVLMLRRHADTVFSGALVFPGGGVDAADRGAALAAPGRANPGLDGDALAFRLAALRESYEEAHLLLARRAGQVELVSATALRGLESESGSPPHFADLVAAGAIEPAIDLLVPFARWVTPERSPRRYDARFFLARAPADQVARPDGREAVAALWLTPEAAIAAADARRERLVFATRMNLLRLAKSRDVATALAAAAACAGRIVAITPEFYEAPSGLRIRIPPGLGRDLDYDDCDLPAADPAARAR